MLLEAHDFFFLPFIISPPENADLLSLMTWYIRHFCAAILSVETCLLRKKKMAYDCFCTCFHYCRPFIFVWNIISQGFIFSQSCVQGIARYIRFIISQPYHYSSKKICTLRVLIKPCSLSVCSVGLKWLGW